MSWQSSGGAGLRAAAGSGGLLVCAIAGVLLVSGSSLNAQGTGHLVIISGLSGEERFARDYLSWGAALTAAATERYGIGAANVVWLAEDAAAHARIRDRSTRANIERELSALAQRAGEGDRVMIVLFGHGSYADGESRFNLPGPDLNAAELALLLEPLESQRVALVNTTSASGGFIEDVAGANRLVITATKSGMEANETIFGGHFTAAMTGDAADADKDGRVSLLEAFEYARLEVARAYERENKLLTEHAVIDAAGDGRGTAELATASPHAQSARSFFLASGTVAGADASPALRALLAEKDRIAAALDALRASKDTMEVMAYEAELEKLLVELARNAQAIRELEGGGP